MMYRNPWWTLDECGNFWTTERFEIKLKSRFKSLRDFRRWILRSTQVKPALIEDDSDLEILGREFPEGSNFYKWNVSDLIKRYDSRKDFVYEILFLQNFRYDLKIKKNNKIIISASVYENYLKEISEIFRKNYSLRTVFDMTYLGLNNNRGEHIIEGYKILEVFNYLETGKLTESLEIEAKKLWADGNNEGRLAFF